MPTTEIPTAFVGIDPGVSGALVLLNLRGTLLRTFSMPETDGGLQTLLNWLAELPAASVWCERVPKFAGNNQTGASAATLFANYRYIAGYLAAKGVHVNYVTPQAWQAPYRKHEPDWAERVVDYGSRKKFLHEIALRELDVTKKKLTRDAADAALIALHGFRANNPTH